MIINIIDITDIIGIIGITITGSTGTITGDSLYCILLLFFNSQYRYGEYIFAGI